MLVSRTDVLAQDLRRQDLLAQTQDARIVLAHVRRAGVSLTPGATFRRALGAALIGAGEWLRGPVIPMNAEDMTPIPTSVVR